MKNPTASVLVLSALSLTLASAAHAQHAGDIGLGVVDNRITTGFYENGTFVPGQRVFGSELGELFLNFTDEPGFDSLPGTFVPGSTITFNVIGALRQWDGSVFSNVTPAERISIGFGPVTPVQTPLTDVVTPGFGIAVASNGEWHRHLEYTLQAPAADGIYLLQLTLAGNTPSAQESLPFWLVFNQNRPEVEHDAAIEWANATLVPTPSAAGLMILAGTFASRRRRASDKL